MADPTNPYAKYAPPPSSGDDSNPYAKYATPPVDQPSGWSGTWAGIKHGLSDLFYGGGQLGARMGPDEGGAAFTDPAELEARKQTVDKAVAAREQAYQAEPAVKAHPHLAYLGDITGQIAASAPLFALPGAAPTLPARALAATIPGAVVAAAEPVISPGDKPGEYKAPDDYGQQKGLQVAGGVVGSAIGQPVGEFIGAGVGKVASGVRWLFQSEEQRAASKAAREAAKRATEAGETPEQKAEAARRVEARFASAQRSGRLMPGDVIKKITEAQAADQPLALVDIDRRGGPVQALAGTVHRAPGDAGGYMEDVQAGRTYEQDPESLRNWQQSRLVRNIQTEISAKDAAEAADEGIEQRAVEGRPLWEAANEGGSTAPLEHQYTREFEAATQRQAAAAQKLREANSELVTARAKQQTSAAAQREAAVTPAQARAKEVAEAGKEAVTGAKPPEPAPSGFNEAERAANAKATEAQQELKQAREDTEASRARLKTAQQDAAENVPGAVWSPHIERILNNRYAKRGLRLGYQMIRTESDARNIPFDPHEWAIKGLDADGNPIVGRVPNMRLIQMAKEGLDSLLENKKYRNPLTRKLTKPGRAIDELRRSLLAEGDRLNPAWAEARQAWAGKSAELEALRDGQFAMHPAKEWSFGDFAKRWDGMKTDGEREMFMIGIADDLIRDIDTTKLTGDTTKATINTPEAMRKLRHMFGSTPEGQAAFDRFHQFVTRDRSIWETGINVFRGADTARRLAADDQAKEAALTAAKHAAHGMWRLMLHHPVEAGRSFLTAMSHLGWGHEKGVNLQMAKLLFDRDPTLRVGQGGTLRVGPQITTPSATPRDVARGAGRGLGGDIGTILTTGPESMFYSAPDSFR